MKILLTIFPSLLFAQLEYSADSLYLVDTGQPVFLAGHSPWQISTNLTLNEAKRYADSCATHDINLWIVSMHSPVDFGGLANENGDLPWQGGTQNFTATPNEAYWSFIDSLVGYAKTKGIYVALYPIYLGNSSAQGIQNEVNAASLDDMYAWGQYVGARYADSTNVFYMLGGDNDPTSWTDAIDTVAAGILSQDTNHLIGTHDHRDSNSDTYWQGRSWLTLGNFYIGDAEDAYIQAKYFRARNPKIPSGMLEGYYENEGTTDQYLRAISYYATLGGALGYALAGNCPIWHFGEYAGSPCDPDVDWAAHLDSQGMKNQKWFARLFRSRYWYKLMPDTLQAVMTAGYGTFGNTTYVTTAYASDGSSIIAYLPAQGSGVTIDPSVLVGDSCRVYWFNPENGGVTAEDSEDTGNTFQVTPPESGDWVLVVDSENFDALFDIPGGSAPLTQITYLPIRIN